MAEVKNEGNSVWEKSQTEVLLSAYEKYPVLYSSTHPDNSNFITKVDALGKIADEVATVRPGVDIHEIKSKLRTLKRKFKGERLKMRKQRRMKTNDVYVPRLWYYDRMKSLIHANNNTVGVSNTDESTINRTMTPGTHNLGPSLPSAHPATKKNTESDNSELYKPFHFMPNHQSKHKGPTREKSFCNYIHAELESFKLEDTFDKVKIKIMRVVDVAKAKEKEKLRQMSNYNTSYRTASSLSSMITPTENKPALPIRSETCAGNEYGNVSH